MSKHEAEISPSAMLYRTVAIKKDNIPNSMLSRRPTPYNFDYTVVLHSHPSAIKTFISLNCSHYNRPDRIRQGLLSIFYQNRVWFLCNCVSSGMVSVKFSYILQATPPHCLLLCAMEADGWTCLYQEQESREKYSYRVSASITAYAPHSHMRDRS